MIPSHLQNNIKSPNMIGSMLFPAPSNPAEVLWGGKGCSTTEQNALWSVLPVLLLIPVSGSLINAVVLWVASGHSSRRRRGKECPQMDSRLDQVARPCQREAVEFSDSGGNPATGHAVSVLNDLVCDIGNSPRKHIGEYFIPTLSGLKWSH